MSRLNTVFRLSDTEYYMNTAELSTVPVALLKGKKASFEKRRQDIIDALDFLM